MEQEIFGADVAPGGPTTRTEVKVLVLTTLSEVPDEIPFRTLHEAVREYGLVNYFELIVALAGLTGTGHVLCAERAGIEHYSATSLGKRTARELATTLPAAVREKAAGAMRLVLRRKKRLTEVATEIEQQNGGYALTLALPEADGVFSLRLFAPSREDCERMRRRFLNDPVYIYQCLIDLLSGKRDVLGEALPEGEDLF